MASGNSTRHHAGQIGKRTKTLLLYTFVTAIVSGMSVTARGQTFSEWFFQKRTQKKYLLEQLAALEVYGGYLKKGYSIARNGLGAVGSYLDEEHGDHALYYDRLLHAGSVVKNDPRVREIIERQREIARLLQALPHAGNLSETEAVYLRRVREAILRDCGQQLQELEKLLSNGRLKAGDRDRIDKLQEIHSATLANHEFSRSLVCQVINLSGGREQRRRETRSSRDLHGIHLTSTP